MKKAYLLLIFFVSVFLASAQLKEVNDPNAELRTVKGFNAIKVSDAIDLFLSQSEEEVVAVSASKVEDRNRIKTEVDNGVLKIWYDNPPKWSRGNKKLRAYVSFKTLVRLQASGACDVRASGVIKANELEIRLSGASDFDGAIQANAVAVDLSGASDMTVSGSATSLKIEVSGASEFKGYDFQADNCSADASGASDIRITVNKELNAHASGASGVHYKGEGVIRTLKTGGASSVNKKS